MRVETLPQGTGPALDAATTALLFGTGPAAGLLSPVSGVSPAAKPTGATPRALADALALEQERHGLGPRAVENAKALASGALAVVTGQQPGLLGGPLLSLHKSAGAIALAASLSKRLARPVVPVFWLGSEDHDWAEANAATVLDTAGAPFDLRLDLVGDTRSVRDVPIPAAAVDDLLARLSKALPATPRAAAAIDLARPPASTDLGAWAATLLGRLLGDAGLVVVEPHVLAPWAGPVFASLVRDAEQIRDAIRAAGNSLFEKGLPVPLAPKGGDAPLFLRDGPRGARRRVALEGTTVTLRGEPAPFDRAGLVRLLEKEPALGSGDVVGRVFVQNALLPVVACVGGPTELAYWAQVAAAHAAVGKPFPAAAPRPSATWVDAKTEEAVRAFGVGLGDVVRGLDRVPEATVAADDPASKGVAAARASIEALEREAASTPAVSKHLAEARRALDEAAAAARAGREERDGRDKGRWRKATDAIRPRGGPQERVLSPISIVARHGVEALRAGLSALEPLAEGHQVVHLD